MSYITIDTEICNHDRHCVATCPVHLIEWDEKHDLPVEIETIAEMCIQCGHCVAVCPTHALSHTAIKADQCESISKDLLPTKEQTAHLLKARRSIRQYGKKPVSRETLAALINVARFAPSGHNSQPVQWQVESDPDRIHRLCAMVADWMRSMLANDSEFSGRTIMEKVVTAWDHGQDYILRGAPHIMIAHGAKENPMVPSAATIALTYLELAAFSHGLGACWAGYFNLAANMWDAMQSALELPTGNMAAGSMMVGYPRYSYHRIPMRRSAQITWR
jgi:nitroreductase/NAD-dependent dihydropyrimidine dehydrogenase PreA subunit